MTPEQRAALEALIGRPFTDPEAAQAAAHVAAWAIGPLAAMLSPLRQPVLGTVPTEQFAAWAASTGMRAVIEDKAAAAGDPLRASALALRDVLMGSIPGIRLDHAGNQAVLTAWVTAGALSQANRDSLTALGTRAAPPLTMQQVEAVL